MNCVKLVLTIDSFGDVEFHTFQNKRYRGYLFFVKGADVHIDANYYNIDTHYSYKFIRKFNQRENEYKQSFENLKYMLVK